jgi:ABC-type dipeptide/oligopeptide/nickel transport system permease component
MLGLTVAIFLILQISGDPAAILLPPQHTEQQAVELRRGLGLDRPLPVQYWLFLSNAVRGDFGNSWQYRLPATELVIERIPATVQLSAAALAIALVIGIPLGMVAATRERSLLDTFSVGLGVLGQAAPNFWLGIILILVFAVKLGWVPTSGRQGLTSVILPAIALGTGFIAQITLLVRSGMLEVLREDYIRTARSKGLPSRTIHIRHAFRNTLIPVVTVVGVMVGRLLGGAVITETVFAWPGVGSLAVQAVSARDMPLVQATVLILAVWIVLANLAVDLVYPYIDPRLVR